MNFLKTAFRYLTRDKVFSYINVLGLAVGLTAVLCIAIYVVRELNYDGFHRDADRIYRVNMHLSGDNMDQDFLGFTAPVGPAMQESIPEIEAYARISSERSFVVLADDKSFKINRVSYADTTFFDMFAFSLVRGNPQTALTAPFSIVLTEESASNIFGDKDPMGQNLRVDVNDYTVTGVVKSLPVNSHLKFDALASFSTLYRLNNANFMGWNGGNQFITYLRLDKNAKLETVEAKMQPVIYDNIGKMFENAGWKLTGSLHALRRLHLYHDSDSEFLLIGIIVFSALGLIILAVACINFVNLTTARSMKRVKEASMRRVLGAKRIGLVKQFLGESLMIAMAAFAVSLLLFVTFHQLFINLAGGLPGAGLMAIAFGLVFILAVITGILGGIFPAVRLTSLDLSKAFKGGGAPKSKRRLQNTLIVMQFASAVFLIVCTIAATSQLSMMRKMDLGFNKDGVVILQFNGNTVADRAEVLKQRLQNLAEVSSVSATSGIPSVGVFKNGYRPEGMENVVTLSVIDADKDFLEAYGIKLLQGRFFSGGEQDKNCYVVNETLAKTFGWNEQTLDKTISRDGEHKIIGVVSDFNFASLYEKIEPLIITNAPLNDRFRSLSVKYRAGNVPAMMAKIETIWTEVNPNTLFEYSFFDELYDRQYKTEMNFRSLFAVFATIAIVLAVLGVLSLMAYTTEQRKKEIGIRKVLGATVKEILSLLLKQTGIQVLIANLLACPLAWWVVQMGLDKFAYRISLGPVIFITAFVISAFAALLAVGFQAMKAASANPVNAIKAE